MDDLIARLRSIPKEVLVTRFDGVPTECGKWAHEAADEIERLKRENEHLARISLAARRLDRAICEFGLKPPFVAEAAQSLHDLLHGSSHSAEDEYGN